MKHYNADALRPPKGRARIDPSLAADLVRDTLARHGLMMPGQSAGATATLLPDLAPLHDLLSRLKVAPGGPSPAPACPDGASFESRTFTCAAGSRSYLTYVPASIKDHATGIVVMLHGCTQTGADFAAGTAMNALAEREGFVVVYPQQARGSNAQSCWNWFSRNDQCRGEGEPAILAGITQQVMAEHGVGAGHTFIAGLSAGAAMAIIMGRVYPDIFAAVGVHSGLPYGAAHDMPSAFAAMGGQGPDLPDTQSRGIVTRMIVFHGSADHTVHPSNVARITRQALDGGPRESSITEETGREAGRSFTRQTTMTPDGKIFLERWVIEGLGHAWSGGDKGGSYTDTSGPDASAEMVRFFFGDTPA